MFRRILWRIHSISATQCCRTDRILLPHARHSTSRTCTTHSYSFTDNWLAGRTMTQSEPSELLEPHRTEEVILCMVQWFDCSFEEAADILNATPQLRSSHLETMDNYVEFLKENGITALLLRQNHWLLGQSITTLRPKLKLLSEIGINSNTVQLLRAGRSSLRLYVRDRGESDLNDRFAFISQFLECPLEEVGELIMRQRRWFMLSMKYERLVRVTKLLLDHGIAAVDIRNDLWVFKNGDRHLEDRLSRAAAARVEPIKPWMLRCTDESFRLLLERRQRIEEITSGRNNRLAYLADRLGCTHREIGSLVERYPLLASMSVVKMKEAFDLLYSNGITSQQIYKYPIILGRRLELLDSRLKEVGSSPMKGFDRLHVLCYPNRKYRNTLNKMTDDKNGNTK